MQNIQIEVRDYYDSAIIGAQLRVVLGDQTSSPWVQLREAGEGIYAGSIDAGTSGRLTIRVEAVLPDGLWIGQRTLNVEGGRAERVLMGLNHADAPKITVLGLSIVVLFGLLYAALALMVVGIFKGKQKMEGRAA